nr:uncharacterized protein LOC126523681 [Dermacentor andersoni]
MTTLAALLLLFAISIVVTSQRLALQFPATQYIDEDVQEKALPRAITANTVGALAPQEGLAKESTPGTRPACGSVYYTFCERAPREFHYRRAANACVETDVVDVANVCNRGANRFSTLDLCLESCVSAEHPAEECFERPLFTRCARQDALSSWWQFEAGKCVLWTFPSGGCPANGSAVFPTAKECEERCGHRGAGCRRPEVVACGRRHLRYPYFAHVYAGEGRVRCLRSSETLMHGHQCLAGANRFRSREACHASCKNRPPPVG